MTARMGSRMESQQKELVGYRAVLLLFGEEKRGGLFASLS